MISYSAIPIRGPGSSPAMLSVIGITILSTFAQEMAGSMTWPLNWVSIKSKSVEE